MSNGITFIQSEQIQKFLPQGHLFYFCLLFPVIELPSKKSSYSRYPSKHFLLNAIVQKDLNPFCVNWPSGILTVFTHLIRQL